MVSLSLSLSTSLFLKEIAPVVLVIIQNHPDTRMDDTLEEKNRDLCKIIDRAILAMSTQQHMNGISDASECVACEKSTRSPKFKCTVCNLTYHQACLVEAMEKKDIKRKPFKCYACISIKYQSDNSCNHTNESPEDVTGMNDQLLRMNNTDTISDSGYSVTWQNPGNFAPVRERHNSPP